MTARKQARRWRRITFGMLTECGSAMTGRTSVSRSRTASAHRAGARSRELRGRGDGAEIAPRKHVGKQRGQLSVDLSVGRQHLAAFEAKRRAVKAGDLARGFCDE